MGLLRQRIDLSISVLSFFLLAAGFGGTGCTRNTSEPRRSVSPQSALPAPAEAREAAQPLGRYATNETAPVAIRGIGIAADQARSLYFAPNSAEVNRQRAKAAVADMCSKITDPARKNHRFLIAGHADQRGPHSMNDQLSQARADAVREILVRDCRITPDSIAARGYGKRYPLDPSDGEVAWSVNRRVELWDLNAQIPYSSVHSGAGPNRPRRTALPGQR